MISAIIQARTGSSRLPNKVFSLIEGKPLLWHVVDRIKSSKHLDSIIVATTIDQQDDSIEVWARENEILCFRGSRENVLERYYLAAIEFNIDVIVRITADDPFKDYFIMDQVIDAFISDGADFAYNNSPPSFPEGLDIEVFSIDALKVAVDNSQSKFEKEHVTQFFHNNISMFKSTSVTNSENLSNLRWTIDVLEDLQFAREVYSRIYRKGEVFDIKDILTLLKKYPQLVKINQGVKRSLMYRGNVI